MSRLRFCVKTEKRELASLPIGANFNFKGKTLSNVVYETRPPFPWAVMMRSAERMSERLAKREKMLLENMNSPAPELVNIDIRVASKGLSGNVYRNNLSQDFTENLKDYSCETLINLLAGAVVSDSEVNKHDLKYAIGRQSSSFRGGPMYSFMENGNADICFYSATHIEEQLFDLVIKANNFRDRSKLAVAASVFGHFVCIHPFPDGNGRAARLLLQRVLKGFGIWDSRNLPLGQLAHLDRKNYIYAMRGLSINGNYERYLEYVTLWILAASDLVFLKCGMDAG